MKKTGQETRHGIAVAGCLIADIFHKIDSYPREGLLTQVRGTDGHVGGIGNLILDLAKLDPKLPIEVSAVVGLDDRGSMMLDQLRAYPNIDLSTVKREGESSVTLVMNAQDTHQRTFFFIPAASDRFDLSCIAWENLNAAIFHLEYLLLLGRVDADDAEFGTHGARILSEAKRRGMATSIDIVSEQSSRAKRVVSCALRYTDYCSINEVEAQAVTGVDLTSSESALTSGAPRAARILKELGVSRWAVIHSPHFSYGLDCETDRFVAVQSLRLPDGYIKGTTGAGDAFCAGILYSAQKGDDLETAMNLATACAACSLSEENSSDGMRSYPDVMKLARALS